jgi:hypothetical protein
LGGSARAALPTDIIAAITITRARMAFSFTSMRLRKTSFPRAFANWLIALKESPTAFWSGRKAVCFSMI